MIKKDFITSAIEYLYDLEVIGLSKDDATSSVAAEIEDLLALNDEKTPKIRYENFHITGTQPEDYQELFFELSEGKTVLAGIRHKNGSKDQPFVHMLLSFAPTANDIESLKEFASQQFKKFSPQFLTVWLKPSLQVNLPLGSVPSRQYMVGFVSKIRELEKPNGYERVTLEKVTTELDFKWYSGIYEDFHSQNPELKDWVPMADKEDFESCISDQLLYRVFIDGVLAGLIGARNEDLLGKSAVYMAELLLSSRFKGQGLATALQRKFIDELPKHVELIWGTIDAKNLPSLKTALRIGRVSIRSEFFIELN